MFIYNELKKRELIEDDKEFNEMIWLRQIHTNDTPLESSKFNYNKDDIRTIKIGFTEFNVD